MGGRPAIFVDTNIIIEAVRVGAWARLRAHENLVTVRKCVEEALSGVPGTPGRISVTEQQLQAPLHVVEVTDRDRAALLVTCEDASALDAGERDLLAHAVARAASSSANASGAFVIVSADQAAVRVAISLGLGDNLVSLEEVLHDAGVKPDGNLKGHYTQKKLSEWKTRHALGM